MPGGASAPDATVTLGATPVLHQKTEPPLPGRPAVATWAGVVPAAMNKPQVQVDFPVATAAVCGSSSWRHVKDFTSGSFNSAPGTPQFQPGFGAPAGEARLGMLVSDVSSPITLPTTVPKTNSWVAEAVPGSVAFVYAIGPSLAAGVATTPAPTNWVWSAMTLK